MKMRIVAGPTLFDFSRSVVRSTPLKPPLISDSSRSPSIQHQAIRSLYHSTNHHNLSVPQAKIGWPVPLIVNQVAEDTQRVLDQITKNGMLGNTKHFARMGQQG